MNSVRFLNQGSSASERYDGPMLAQQEAGDTGLVGTNLQMNVRRARNLRQLRKRLFGREAFSGPPWDILLHLFESHTLQRRCSIGNVCDGADLPCTTGLRWFSKLEQKGLIRLRDDHFDGRRRFVDLTDSGIELMTKYFCGVAPHLIAA